MKKLYILLFCIITFSMLGCGIQEKKDEDNVMGSTIYLPPSFEGKVIEVLNSTTVKLKITKNTDSLKKNDIVEVKSEKIEGMDFHNNKDTTITYDENYKLKEGDIVTGQYKEDAYHIDKNGNKSILADIIQAHLNGDFYQKAK